MIFFRFGFSILITFLIVGAIVDDNQFIENKWLTFGVAAFALWMAAGAIAHRLVRPLTRVAAVAQSIGDGELSSRVSLSWRSPGEIRDLGIAINDMAERIERQISDQRALLAAVSHEIRTPLGHMRVLAELAQSGDTSRLAELDEEISMVDGLVDKLLASSRLDFNTLSVRKLDATLACVRALERADLDASLIHVDVEDAGFEGDAMLVSRAIGNLLENAERHGGGASAVRIAGSADSVSIAVSDSGPGFPDELLEQPFADFRPAGGSDGSLGLGLALAERIAVAHGGSLEANNLDFGAEVTLTFPRQS